MPEVLDAPAEVTEVPEIGTETVDTPDVDVHDPVATDEQVDETRTLEQIEIDSKQPLYKQAKVELDKIQATNPSLAAKIKDALFRDQQLAKDLPEGIKGAVALRTEASSLVPGFQGTPAEVLAEAKGQIQYFHGLDQKFTNGDPTFASDLAAASPEAFQKLAPSFISEFAKTNPEGYTAYISQAVVSHMNAADVPLQFKMLGLLVPRLPESPEKNEIIDAINKLHGWTEEINGYAKQPITLVAKKTDDAATLETKRQELAQRETEVTLQSWNNISTKFGYDLRDKEISRLAGKTAITEDQRNKINNKVYEEIDARLAANKGYGEAMRGFLQAKDAEGYKRRLHSEYQKLIPGAVSRAYADVVTSKPAVAKISPKAVPVSEITPKSNEGFRPISKYPVGQVDMRQTTGKMMDEGKLILKDGSKVIYKRRA